MPTHLSRPTRLRILDAAEHLMRTAGLGRATTKEIAREAGCSEAALYKHFATKEEIFLRVLFERLPDVRPLLKELTADPGERSVEDCLTAIALQSTTFYGETIPMAGALFAETALLARHREGLAKIGRRGPKELLDALDQYLQREQARERVRAAADTRAAAALLLGACFQRAFFQHFYGEKEEPSDVEFAAAVARTVRDAIG